MVSSDVFLSSAEASRSFSTVRCSSENLPVDCRKSSSMLRSFSSRALYSSYEERREKYGKSKLFFSPPRSSLAVPQFRSCTGHA